jgi:uncharacterized membrane protein
MEAELWIVSAHTFSTVALAGLIWFVQVVHYPLLAEVGEREFARYETMHCRRTGPVVAPLMLGEFATAAWLLFRPPAPDIAWATASGFLLLLAVWSSTAFLQVPCHRRLQRGFDPATVKRLVATNWIRTIAWTARGLLALHIAGSTFAAP